MTEEIGSEGSVTAIGVDILNLELESIDAVDALVKDLQHAAALIDAENAEGASVPTDGRERR